MHIAGYRVETVAQHPALAERMNALIGNVWPRYIIEGHWPDDGLYRDWYGPAWPSPPAATTPCPTCWFPCTWIASKTVARTSNPTCGWCMNWRRTTND